MNQLKSVPSRLQLSQFGCCLLSFFGGNEAETQMFIMNSVSVIEGRIDKTLLIINTHNGPTKNQNP